MILNSPGYGTQFECTTTKNQQTTQNQKKKKVALHSSGLQQLENNSSLSQNPRQFFCSLISPSALRLRFNEFSSVQLKTVSMRSKKPICAPPVSQKFPQRCL